jgi:uncharacterized membrane protein YdjX (TVP38/TMEM64 family)
MITETQRRAGLLLFVFAGIVTAYAFRDQLSVEQLVEWVRLLGWLAPLVFIASYAVAAVFFLPGLLFTLAGGALFGPLYGTLYNLIGATIGATLAFLAARYIARDWVTQRSGNRLRQLVEGVDKEGWRFVAFTRLVPLFPFNLLNYALGLTKIRLSHYIITTFIFMSPAGAAYTYLGYAGREAAAGGEDYITKALLALAVVAIIAFSSNVLLRLRRDRT